MVYLRLQLKMRKILWLNVSQFRVTWKRIMITLKLDSYWQRLVFLLLTNTFDGRGQELFILSNRHNVLYEGWREYDFRSYNILSCKNTTRLQTYASSI